MSATLDNIPPGQCAITVACNICGGPIHTHHDADAPQWALTVLLRCVACVNCIDRADGKEKSRRAGERLEVRSLQWATLCPHEFRKALDWTRCDRRLHDRLMAWSTGERGLYVHGRTGLSKTRFLFCVLHREHLAGRSCAFVVHADFRREVSFLAQTDAVAMRRYLSVLTRADVVLFDDLGNGVITPAGEEAFEMVLGSRTRNGKPTLFTSNTGPEKLAERFSAERSGPILRRITEFCEDVKL